MSTIEKPRRYQWLSLNRKSRRTGDTGHMIAPPS
jgi:hypothetical protein